jgi:hypothetical protein
VLNPSWLIGASYLHTRPRAGYKPRVPPSGDEALHTLNWAGSALGPMYVRAAVATKVLRARARGQPSRPESPAALPMGGLTNSGHFSGSVGAALPNTFDSHEFLCLSVCLSLIVSSSWVFSLYFVFPLTLLLYNRSLPIVPRRKTLKSDE